MQGCSSRVVLRVGSCICEFVVISLLLSNQEDMCPASHYLPLEASDAIACSAEALRANMALHGLEVCCAVHQDQGLSCENAFMHSLRLALSRALWDT